MKKQLVALGSVHLKSMGTPASQTWVYLLSELPEVCRCVLEDSGGGAPTASRSRQSIPIAAEALMHFYNDPRTPRYF